MRTLMPLISVVGLALVIVPAVAYLTGSIEKGSMNAMMLVGTVIWFGTAPIWMDRRASRQP